MSATAPTIQGFHKPLSPKRRWRRERGVGENKKLVRRQFELINAGDVAGAAALWSPATLNHGRRADPPGIAKVYESLRALGERHTLHELIAEGDRVAVRTTCDRVHSATPSIPVNGGIFTGVTPTVRGYSVQHIHLFKVVDGRITEHRANRDDPGAARQVGLELRSASGG
ncbi:MAG: ester cyclase [Thermoplasmata archaeon]